MSEILLVNFKEYWKSPVKPRNFEDFVEMLPSDGRIRGIWEMLELNPRTREVYKRVWSHNAITDQGANYMLQRALNSSAATLPNLFNNLLITNNDGSCQLTANLAANATNVTSLAVNGTAAAIPSGTQLQLGFGTGNTQTVTTNGATLQGATSITVNSFTVNSTGFIIGAQVVPLPQVTDNPTNTNLTSNATTPLSQYSGNLATGAFTYTPTSGAGNRTALVQYEFDNATNGGSTANGGYTSVWICNVSSGATTNNYLAHEINNVLQVGNNSSISAKATVKV